MTKKMEVDKVSKEERSNTEKMTTSTSTKMEVIKASNKDKTSVPVPQEKLRDMQFVVFSIMFSSSLVHDMTEVWFDDLACSITCLLFVVFLASKCRLSTYFLFLAYNVLTHWLFFSPNFANHINFAFLIVLQHCLVFVYLLCKHRKVPTRGELFTHLRPAIGGALVLVYFFAGFHKLNWGFLDTEYGCTADFVNRMKIKPGNFEWMARLWLGAPFYQSKYNATTDGLTTAQLFVVEHQQKLEMKRLAKWILSQKIYVMSILTLVWEILGGLSLLVGKTQPYMLLYSIFMHSTLCPLGFYDFSSMVFSIFVLYIPDNYFEIYYRQSAIMSNNWIKLHRHIFYAGSPLLVSYVAKTYETNQDAFLGFAYLGFFAVMLQPLIRAHLHGQLPDWNKPFQFLEMRPRCLLLTHLFMILFGMSNYFGLRTAGTFSMFSNLVTEGERSNHILLGSNPLKIWNYQEDVVKVRKSDSGLQIRGPIAGYRFPLIEFQRNMAYWRADNYTDSRSISFEYRGIEYAVDDVRDLDEDFILDLDDLTWEHLYLQFRKIQQDGNPIRCRW